ncbi:MAG: hypothetical protein HQ579_03390 [Candidatus Omnitrophica bacterium]|nr:hypothetical protein [Candidatus Omnitrophota bacterium]
MRKRRKKATIGIAKEKAAGGMELRPSILPKEVKKVVEAGYPVFVEKGLGKGIYIDDDEYRKAGAKIISKRKDIFNKDVVVKLKPPLSEEFRMLKDNLLFCMLHAEQNPQFLTALKRSGSKAIAMELITNSAGERLIKCSHMAGEQGMIMAFHQAKKIPSDCRVLVLGYGDIASGAIKVAYSLGADVKILRKCEYRYMRHFLRNKDILVNGIKWPKEKRESRDYLVTRKMLPLINRGGVILDLSVDYPNPIETCHPTMLNKPDYVVDGIRHISIFGYPGLAPISSARIYSRQILTILLRIAGNHIDRFPRYLKNALIIP